MVQYSWGSALVEHVRSPEAHARRGELPIANGHVDEGP
jgi:hypothetical protein